MALWQSLVVLVRNQWFVLGITTLLFAAGHFAAYWFVPNQFRSFVIYQTVYVTLLGAATGWRRFRTDCVSSAIFVHFGFNFGFYLAARAVF
jgi:membrane protease YdiL (CAAX protease family)